jgi:hypothetical protein
MRRQGASSSKTETDMLLFIPTFRNVYLALFLAFAFGITISQGPLLVRLWQISADPVSTIGHVTVLYCPDHGHVDYSFTVDGASYSAGHYLVDGIDCPNLKLGQRIAVYYERGAPENNYGFYPADTTGNRARSAFWIGLIFLSVSVVMGPLFLTWMWTVVSRISETRRF